MEVKKHDYIVGTIIYQLHVSAVIGHLQVGIQSQRKNIYYKYRCGGRDLVYKYMGLVVEPVLELGKGPPSQRHTTTSAYL